MTENFLFISTQEIFVILIIVVMLFGSKKIPELARSLGKGIRELKDASNDIRREIQSSADEIKKEAKEIDKDLKN
ncbi:MAG: twin-arginine translocase TatA/TatE family subunit [Flavobacteriales bacterium]|nr:twin-arginine translocase TatA/TatE family subunit [Flavobacteriales bacterium]|tara:strand:+ start:670 stop:894 length:225 start_codon:yes stop_codon:yes gene_type:complete